MRFVWAVAAFVLAALMIGFGIAQRTVLQGPDAQTVAIEVDQPTPYLLIDGTVFNSLPGTQTLRAQAEGTVFAAFGRTIDMTAWLADATYTSATMTSEGTVTTKTVPPVQEDPEKEKTETATPTPGATGTAAAEMLPGPGRNPAGSDLWLDEFMEQDLLITPLQLPDTMSVLVATDGKAAAPSDVVLSWPVEHSTPLAGPLLVGGGLMMLLGVFFYILGIRHTRRSRGPRRKGLPLPPTEPIDLAIDNEDKGVISSGKPTRRSVARSRRSFVVVPLLLSAALAATACSPDAWPDFSSTATPTPSDSVLAPEDQQQPAVTKAQAERILAEISATVAEADANRNLDQAQTRLGGATLAARATNYTLREHISDYEVPQPIPTDTLQILLPQAYDSWPRTVITVVEAKDTNASHVMVLSQADPWAMYQLIYEGNLEASTTLPKLAPDYIGARQIPPDSSFLLLPPEQVSAAYADVLDNGDKSEFAELFDAESDHFRSTVSENRQARLNAFNESGSDTGTLTFDAQAGSSPVVALATVESGAIVVVDVVETDTVKPTNPDAVIKLGDNPAVKALIGADKSATGVVTSYGDQLFFYVPAPGTGEKIQLLGYSSAILSAKEI